MKTAKYDNSVSIADSITPVCELPTDFYLIDESFHHLLKNDGYKDVLIKKQRQAYFSVWLLVFGFISLTLVVEIATSNKYSDIFSQMFFTAIIIMFGSSPLLVVAYFVARPHMKAIKGSRLIAGEITETKFSQRTYGYNVYYKFTTENGRTFNGMGFKPISRKSYGKTKILPPKGTNVIVVYNDSGYHTIL